MCLKKFVVPLRKLFPGTGTETRPTAEERIAFNRLRELMEIVSSLLIETSSGAEHKTEGKQ